MTNVAIRLLDASFGHPQGLLGRLGGKMMAHFNAETEHQMVRLARLSAQHTVLVVGPGPGVGLRTAGEQAGLAIGVDPSEAMLALARERCGALAEAGRVELRHGSAVHTQQADASVDVVLSVNNVQLWPDRPAGFAELFRVLRPGGRLLLSVHEKHLPVAKEHLAAEARTAGFTEVQTWSWQPRGRAPIAAQLAAERPL